MEELLKAIQSEDPGHNLRGRSTAGSKMRNSQGLEHQTSRMSAISCQDSLLADMVTSKPASQFEEKEEQDLLTWCHECNARTLGECFIHGKVIAVTDNKLPSRARLSLPSILVLKKIKECNPERYGVFAKRSIKPRTQFGPLEAPVLSEGGELLSGVFDVRIIRQGEQKCLDLSREDACNWMMFVRPASTSQEANLGAYQLHDQIYYISTKVISQMCELRVWYISSYGQLFGKEPLPPSVSQQLTPSGENADSSSTQHEHEGLGTRAAMTLPPEKLMCGFCNTLFRSLSQLVAHACNTVDDMDNPDASRPARRKGLPRKMGSSCSKDQSDRQISSQPPHLTVKSEVDQSSLEENQKTDIAPDQKVVRKRGRPKGSKTKQSCDEPATTVKQTETNRKRKKPRLDCHFCHRSFYSEEQYRIHEAEHTGTKPYICEYPGCNKGFGSKFKHWRHSLVHQKPQNRVCAYCNRSFNRVDHLKNHVMTHNSKRKLWTCEKCGKQYLYHSTYLFHIALHKARESSTLSCSLCNTEYPTREELINHVKSHNRYKPDPGKPKSHQCPECQKFFTTKKDVRRHMVTHTKDRSFLCEFCPQTFARKDHLRRHYKSSHKREVLEQTADVDFPCPVCLNVFKSEEYLKYHQENAHCSTPEAVGNAKKGDRQVAQQRVMHSVQSSTQVMLVPVQKVDDVSQEQTQQHIFSHHMVPRSLLQPQHIQSTQQPQPIHIHINQHHQQKLTLQPASFPSSLAAGMSGGQAIQVLSEGGEQYNCQAPQMLMLKAVPYRLSSHLTATQSASATVTAALSHNLQQIPNSYSHLPQDQQQQQQPQQTQAQPSALHQAYVSTDSISAISHPTIVSMLAVSTTDGALDSTIKGTTVYAQDVSGHLKAVSAGWLLTGNPSSPLPDVSAAHPEMGDHCYATATTGAVNTNAGVGLKLTAVPAGSKIMGHLTHSLEQDALHFFQSSNGSEQGSTNQSVSQSNTTPGSSELQATWETISDLVTIPLTDCDIMPPVTAPQPSIVSLPVALRVQTPDGSACASPATLSHHT